MSPLIDALQRVPPWHDELVRSTTDGWRLANPSASELLGRLGQRMVQAAPGDTAHSTAFREVAVVEPV